MQKLKEILALYPVRAVKIEDMELNIKELELGEALSSMGFEERVQTSRNCKNNDEILFKIENLKTKINLYKTQNLRVERLLNYIKNEKQRIVIEGLYLKGKSKTAISREIDRTRKQVENLCKQGLENILIAENKKIV